MTYQFNSSLNLIAKLTSNKSSNMGSYSAIFLVSVGKELFEGEFLRAALTMINREFKRCFIIVADTLQRYNIASLSNLSPEEAHQEALIYGNQWLNEHQSCFDELFDIPYEILRWSDLLQYELFNIKENTFVDHLKSNKLLSDAMSQSINQYLLRISKRTQFDNDLTELERYRFNCFNYLKEECIAIAMLPEVLVQVCNEPITIVYPGKPTAILVQNREIFIKSEFKMQSQLHVDYLNWLVYKLDKIKIVAQLNPPKK